MKFSILDVVLVGIFLATAIIGGALGVLSKELVAAIITAAVAFLAARGKALFDKTKAEEKQGRDEKDEQLTEDGAPNKPMDGHHSHRLLIGENGSVKVEDVPALPDEHVIVGVPEK